MKDMMKQATPCLGLVMMVLSLWMAPALAQSQQLEGGGRPWSQGVSPEAQQKARALFDAGNASLAESIFTDASEKYLQALRHWDHPAIHYNLALALMKLDRPLEVHEHLISAMSYGPAPLGADKYENASQFKGFLDTQLVRVTISCDQPGATVTLDGRTLFVAPGRYEGLVRPGTHSVIATQDGYLTTDKSRSLMPGEQATFDLKLYTERDVTRFRRRWPVWMPWTVMGSGLLVAAGGGLFHLQTSQSYSDFDAGITQCGGCDPAPPLKAARARGDNLQRVTFGTYALGGAVFVTGVVLLTLNQQQAYRIDPGKGEEHMSVTPLLGSTNGLLATFRF